MKIVWEDYEMSLIKNGFTPDEINEVKKVRESDEYEHCNFEVFNALLEQGVVVRTAKLKKPRNLYVNKEGQFLYFNSYKKAWYYVGYFKE